jgi:ATP-dependent Lon protease
MFQQNFFNPDNFNEEGESIPLFSINDDELQFNDAFGNLLPVLALKNTVLFPGVVIPITVGRDKSIRALQKAEKSDKFIAVLTQKDINNEDPGPEDLHEIGTIAKVMKILRMPDGNTTAILQGRKRFRATQFQVSEKLLEVVPSTIEDVTPVKNIKFNATMASIRDFAKKIIELSPNIPFRSQFYVAKHKKQCLSGSFYIIQSESGR